MKMADGEVTHRICFCTDRIAAMNGGTFRFSHTWGGWWFIDTPTRTMSSHAKYFAFHERAEYRHEDHTGEPFVHVECPWCGNALPGARVEGEDRGPFGAQGDGASGEELP